MFMGRSASGAAKTVIARYRISQSKNMGLLRSTSLSPRIPVVADPPEHRCYQERVFILRYLIAYLVGLRAEAFLWLLLYCISCVSPGGLSGLHGTILLHKCETVK